MTFEKNRIIPLEITSLSNDGNGVGHVEGMAVFVAGAVVGDLLDVRLVKLNKSYAFGIIERIHKPSPHRIEPDCAVCKSCGGCDFRAMTYEAELASKQGFVQDAMNRLGGLNISVEPILPSPTENGYRNKVQYPVARLGDGKVTAGFYASRSHRVIPCPDCHLQPELLNGIIRTLCRLMEQMKVSVYDEATGKGLVRHLYLRHGVHSGEVMVCLVCNGRKLPRQDEFVEKLLQKHREITTVVLNVNTKNTNVVTGTENIVLFGPGYIRDTMCGVPVQLDPLAFYQVNTLGAEQLYGVAAQYATENTDSAAPTGKGLLLDLYCGAGTIGLSMADRFERLIGVEIVPQAVENARSNAAAMGLDESQARFLCADAGTAAAQLAAEGLKPDVIVLDPPRKGCDTATLDAVLQMEPTRVVMVSCNASTAARDVRYLADHGYQVQKVKPVDMFPRTKHVETIVLLSKGEVDSKKIRVEFSLEDMDMSEFQDGATYPQIKEYVLEHTGLKVSNLYISRIKRKCGIEVGKNYNLPKSEDSRQPQCPPEKEKAIREAFKYFGMI